MAERAGFEPAVPCGTPDFESGTFDHSATSPRNLGLHQCVKNGKINHSNYGLNIVKLTIY